MNLSQVPIVIVESLQDLLNRLRQHYGDRLAQVALYGSVARGTQNAQSDVDVLVVLDRIDSLSDRTEAYGIAADVNLQRKTSLELQLLSRRELEFLRQTETLLARNLDRDGIIFYDTELK